MTASVTGSLLLSQGGQSVSGQRWPLEFAILGLTDFLESSRSGLNKPTRPWSPPRSLETCPSFFTGLAFEQRPFSALGISTPKPCDVEFTGSRANLSSSPGMGGPHLKVSVRVLPLQSIAGLAYLSADLLLFAPIMYSNVLKIKKC